MRESHEKLLEISLQAVGGAPGGGWSGSGPSDWLTAYVLFYIFPFFFFLLLFWLLSSFPLFLFFFMDLIYCLG